MRYETVDEYLARGGKITICPPQNLSHAQKVGRLAGKGDWHLDGFMFGRGLGTRAGDRFRE